MSLAVQVFDRTTKNAPFKGASSSHQLCWWSLTTKYSKEKIDLNEIVDFHYNFEIIHPFQDGNGRVGRLIMFKECLKHNIVPFIIEDENKQFYYMGLEEYPNSKVRLNDTCLFAQDVYKDVLKYLDIDWDK